MGGIAGPGAGAGAAPILRPGRGEAGYNRHNYIEPDYSYPLSIVFYKYKLEYGQNLPVSITFQDIFSLSA